MPNYCSNDLTITLIDNTEESRKQLKEFIKKAKTKGTKIDFEKFIPMPEELVDTKAPSTVVPDSEYEKIHEEEVALFNQRKAENPDYDFKSFSISKSMSEALIEKYGADNWYDWRVRNWGIKWNIQAEINEKTENSVSYYFDSPWLPPIKAFEKISELFPLLHFEIRYEEPGCCFRGVAEFENGDCSDFSEEYTPEEEDDRDDDFGREDGESITDNN